MEKEKGRADGEETAGEPDGLKLENASLKAELKSRVTTIEGLEKAAVEKDKETAALKQSLEAAMKQVESMKNSAQQAVAAYRELAVQSNPGVVAEMITGDSIEAVNESLTKAQSLVEKVRQEMAAENARVKVPAGAPQRLPSDLSALSPREKIKYGMEGG